MSAWKRDAASGLVVLVPLLTSAYVVIWLYRLIANLPFLEQAIDSPQLRVLLTLVVFSLLVLGIGYLMRTAFGTIVENAIDNAMNRVPVLRVVYNASKMAVETALSGTSDLQTPVKVTPWNDQLRMTAFKTGRRTEDGRHILFLPTAPNITSGFVIELEEDDFVEIDETVEEALTRILSAGFGEKRNDNAGVPIEVIGESSGTSGDAGSGGDGTSGGRDRPGDNPPANE